MEYLKYETLGNDGSRGERLNIILIHNPGRLFGRRDGVQFRKCNLFCCIVH